MRYGVYSKGKKKKFKNLLYIRAVILCAFLIILCVCSTSFAASEKSLNKRGNILYREGKFDEALRQYNEALTKKDDSVIINFNAGDALYRKTDYQKAMSSFTKALACEDRNLEEKANYNIGNTKYKAGKSKEESDLKTAVNLIKESLDYYKKAVELNTKDKDAKFNYEFAEKELNVLQEKLKQQQKKEEQNKNKEDQKKEGENKEGQGAGAQKKEKTNDEKKEEKQKEELQPKEGQLEQGQKKEEQKVQEAKSEKENKESQQDQQEKESQEQKTQEEAQQTKEVQPGGSEGASGGQKQEKGISKEQALMLLEGYRQEELTRGELKDMPRQGRYPEVEKNW